MTFSVRPLSSVVTLTAAAVIATGCEFARSNAPAPSAQQPIQVNVPGAPPPPGNGGNGGGGGGAGSMLGTWASVNNTPLTDSSGCTGFQWAITDQTATSVSGTFSAICLGNVPVNGSASGQLSGSQVVITIQGSAVLSGVTCTFSVTGTGTIENDALRIPYSGNTCLGPVSGTETLRRPSTNPNPPTPEPPPPPPPPPPTPPSSGAVCKSSDPDTIVECVMATWPEKLVAHVDLPTRQAHMAFLRDRMIEAGKCGGLDLGWNLKRGGPEISIDFLAQRLNGEVLGIDIGYDYDNLDKTLELQWLLGTFPFYLEYPQVNCGG